MPLECDGPALAEGPNTYQTVQAAKSWAAVGSAEKRERALACDLAGRASALKSAK